MTTEPSIVTGAGRISRAYEQLCELIVYGRLPPGARIAEGALADTLGVSRTPVREALQRLRQEGLLVDVGGGSGLRGRLAVAPLQRERMEELYALAGAVEGLAARGLTRLEGAQREALAQRLEEIEYAFHEEAARHVPELDRLFELHQAFHRTFVDAGAGPRDSMMLAIKRTMGISIRAARAMIEVTVVTLGWFLGGPAGFGTLAFAILVGPAVQWWFKIFKVQPHKPIDEEVAAGVEGGAE